MMDGNTPRIRSLLRQAKRTEDAGKRAAAEELYRDVIAESPETVDGWLGLARVMRDETKTEEAYLQALELDGDNAEAKIGLAEIRGEDTADLLDNQEEDVQVQPVESSQSDLTAEAVNQDEDSVEAKSRLPVFSLEDDSAPGTETLADDFSEEHSHQPEITPEVLYCTNHPSRQTHLRCNRCGKPICSSCARPTPVGYRCPECIREQEDVFYSATIADYLVAAIIAIPTGLIAGFIAWRVTTSFIGFLIIFLAPLVGNFLGRIVFRAAGRRRGRWLPHIVAGSIALGGILFLLANLVFGNIFGIIFMGIYIVAASGAAYYQMR